MTVDIENIESLVPYLRDRNVLDPHGNCSIQILRGGVSNKAVILSRDQGEDIVIKQGLHKLRVDKTWYCDPKRLKVEYTAMQWLFNVLEKGSIPKPLFWDDSLNILGMKAIPHPHQNLKSLLLNEEIDLTLIEKMGSNLAKIHVAGRQSEEARQTFTNKSYFKDLRIEPYYVSTSEEIPALSVFFNNLAEETLQLHETIVHGDYSPKNMLVRNGRLVLLDHEVTHCGDPMFDVGFALCHLLSKANHLPNSKDKLIEAAQVFWKTYEQNCGTNSLRPNSNVRAVKHTIACLIARIKGKSPLEYLTGHEKERQLHCTVDLIDNDIKTIPAFISKFSQNVEKFNLCE